MIRKNTFIGQRIFTPFDNATMVWLVGPGVDGNLISKNVLQGSEGLGIVVEAGSFNRIVGNQFSNLPGEKETLTPFPGTAIFLDAPTTGNRVRGNQFKNVVNAVLDLGTGNIVEDNVAASLAAQSLLQPAAGEGTAMLDHPRLRLLRDRMKN